MARYREHYDVLLVDVRCNLVGEISLRSITKHHRTPCINLHFPLLYSVKILKEPNSFHQFLVKMYIQGYQT